MALVAASGCGAAKAGIKIATDVAPAPPPVPGPPTQEPPAAPHTQDPPAYTPGVSPPATVYAPPTPSTPAPRTEPALIQALHTLSGQVAAPLMAPTAIPTPVPPPGKSSLGAQAKVLGRTSYQVCLGFVARPGQTFTSDGTEPVFCYGVQKWPSGTAAADATESSQPPKPHRRTTLAQPIQLTGIPARLYDLSSVVAVEMHIAGFAVEVEGTREQALAEAGLLAAIPSQAWPQGTGWLWASAPGPVTMSWSTGSLQWTAQSTELPAAGLVRMAGTLRPVSP
jgi:hypothetical protein